MFLLFCVGNWKFWDFIGLWFMECFVVECILGVCGGELVVGVCVDYEWGVVECIGVLFGLVVWEC